MKWGGEKEKSKLIFINEERMNGMKRIKNDLEKPLYLTNWPREHTLMFLPSQLTFLSSSCNVTAQSFQNPSDLSRLLSKHPPIYSRGCAWIFKELYVLPPKSRSYHSPLLFEQRFCTVSKKLHLISLLHYLVYFLISFRKCILIFFLK